MTTLTPAAQTSVTYLDLDVMDRDETLNPRQLRSASFLPATLYGAGKASKNIQVRTKDFTVLFGRGERYFNLKAADGSVVKAKAQQIQMNVLEQRVLNIEFLLQN